MLMAGPIRDAARVTRRSLTLVLLVTTAAAAATSLGQSPPPGPAPSEPDPAAVQAELRALVEHLDSEILQQRLDAAKSLRERPEFNLKTIEGVLRTAALSPEQHRQLVSVAWERFKSEPRPAMGISSNYNQRGAVVQFVTPGFPATQVLRAGDRIEVAEGVKLDEFDTLRHVILSRDPGDEMALSILRDGVVMNVKVTLGRVEDLRGQALMEISLVNAFRQFRARDYLERGGSEPIDSGLSAEAWTLTETIAPELSEVAYIDHGETDGTQSPMPVVAGGEPRGTLMNARAMRLNARMDDAEVELRMLNGFRQQLERDIEAARVRLADPDLNEATRDTLRALNARNERHLVIYRDLIRQRTEQQRRGR